MDFAFSEEDELFRRTLRRFAERELAPRYQRHDREKTFPEEQLRGCAELGLLGLRIPEAYGGNPQSYLASGIAAEEIAREDFNVAYFPLMYGLVGELLARYGSEELKARWLPRMARGEIVAGLALTEPGAGSDAAALACRAEREGDEYVLTGEKSSISFCSRADMVVVFARTSPGTRAQGISAFCVPTDLPGIERRAYNSMGSKCLGRGSLFLDRVRVPAAERVGEENRAFRMVMETFDYSRAVIGLMCLGSAARALERTREHVKQRKAFGRPLATFEGVSFPLAEHSTYVEAARLLCYKTLWLRDRNLPHTREAAMAKWWAPKVAVDALHDCLLLHGHYGYTDEYPIEQQLRDVMGLEIGDGTAQISKLVIAREELGREYRPY
ncbi:MAG: acyl-CoA dehydrogenase [Candidatus Binatia bacterium]|nr:MAG: acyl-CoA dehydrogenase [Candidatus Binatia bacterium]